MVLAQARKRKANFRIQALDWKAFDSKGKQAFKAKPFTGKALDSKGQHFRSQALDRESFAYKPRDSETADSEDRRNHAFLHTIPYSGGKTSIHPDGVVLTNAVLPKYKSSSIYKLLPGRAFWWCLQKPGKGKQTLEAKPFIGKAFDLKGKPLLTAPKPFIGKALGSKGQQALEAKQLLRPLQYCRERPTAIVPALQGE